jgi:hypothetical protein
LVRAALDPKSDLGYDGFSEGGFNRGGDAAAVAVTKVLAGKDLDADEVNRVLLVITRAFAAPKIIEVNSDREPRTTLFVLKYLASLRVSPELNKKIAETKQFVEQAAKSVMGPPSSP